jgi:hypothetical protein
LLTGLHHLQLRRQHVDVSDDPVPIGIEIDVERGLIRARRGLSRRRTIRRPPEIACTPVDRAVIRAGAKIRTL